MCPMTATKTKPREVVTADDVRVGDVLFTDGPDLYVERIEEKPKTRVLHLRDTDCMFEDTYRIRRTTRIYVRARQAFEVRQMVDSYGPCINDSLIVRTMDEAREVAARWIERAASDEHIPGGMALDWVEIVEGEYPGKTDEYFEYSADAEVVRIDP